MVALVVALKEQMAVRAVELTQMTPYAPPQHLANTHAATPATGSSLFDEINNEMV